MHRRQFSYSLLALLATSRAFAQAVALDRSGLALGGYDPMAYFIYRRAAKGNTEFSMVWEGATYQFDSFEHLRIFAYEPLRYAPQYGGYCATAMAKGERVNADAEVFNVIDGKLYLHSSAAMRDKWLADAKGNIAAADTRWREQSGVEKKT